MAGVDSATRLQTAERRVRELERQLGTKDNELRLYRFQVRSLRRGDRSGRPARERRMARAGDLFRQRSMIRDQEEEGVTIMYAVAGW